MDLKQLIPELRNDLYEYELQDIVVNYLTEQGYNPDELRFKIYKCSITPLNAYTRKTLEELNIIYNEEDSLIDHY